MCLESSVDSSNREKTEHLILEGEHQQLLNIFSNVPETGLLGLTPIFSQELCRKRGSSSLIFFREKARFNELKQLTKLTKLDLAEPLSELNQGSQHYDKMSPYVILKMKIFKSSLGAYPLVTWSLYNSLQ